MDVFLAGREGRDVVVSPFQAPTTYILSPSALHRLVASLAPLSTMKIKWCTLAEIGS